MMAECPVIAWMDATPSRFLLTPLFYLTPFTLQSNAHRVADKSDEDTVATNSINPFSTSESSSLSSSPVTGQGDDSLALRVSAFGLSNYEVGYNQELTNHRASAEAMAIETEGGAMMLGADEDEAEFGLLDASLRNAEMQATLEAFKARHPTLPLVRTDAWRQGRLPVEEQVYMLHLSGSLLRFGVL
ncbi:unnamed protein product [Dibothriocephalus latus]|uniref:Uncharacterized protein n=1 Tax=Dibothriocephalus latus TaxID=60516 RepID=A0A3P6UHA6_DIBLA|nr:unnamed protein product [Dibothriocephalus latus]